MEDQNLKNAIKEARKAMELAKDVDKEDFLGKVLSRIVTGDLDDETIPAQLEQQALDFESKHPRLAASLREVLDALQRMGI